MRHAEELRKGTDRKRLSDLRQMLAKLDFESMAQKYANSQLFTDSCETMFVKTN